MYIFPARFQLVWLLTGIYLYTDIYMYVELHSDGFTFDIRSWY